MLGGFKGGCIQFLNSRRVDVGYVSSSSISSSLLSGYYFHNNLGPFTRIEGQSLISSQMTAQFQQTSISPPPQSQSQSQSTPRSQSQYTPPSQTPTFLHPNSNQWQTTSDFLPPPPQPPILRSGGIPSTPAIVDSPRRVTRSQAGSTPAKGDIGDKERNPYRKGTRREGGGVV